MRPRDRDSKMKSRNTIFRSLSQFLRSLPEFRVDEKKSDSKFGAKFVVLVHHVAGEDENGIDLTDNLVNAVTCKKQLNAMKRWATRDL